MPVLTRAPLLAIAAASLAGAFVAGRLTVKPRTVETVREVQAKQTQQAQQQAKVETRTVYVQGPERVRTVRYDCPTGKPSEERIEERGPVRTETATNTATVTQVRTQLEYRDRIETRHERDTWAVGASVGTPYFSEIALAALVAPEPNGENMKCTLSSVTSFSASCTARGVFDW